MYEAYLQPPSDNISSSIRENELIFPRKYANQYAWRDK